MKPGGLLHGRQRRGRRITLEVAPEIAGVAAQILAGKRRTINRRRPTGFAIKEAADAGGG